MAGLVYMRSEIDLHKAREYWDGMAHSFDDEPDHGLRDPGVLSSWTKLLSAWLPNPLARLLDIGCGTGSLSVVLAGLGYQVSGIDLSPNMIDLAREKAARLGHHIEFEVMDAAFPQLQPHQFDGIVCRHLLWALPDPAGVLGRWAELMRPGGRLLLIEGFWETGGGLHAKQIIEMLPPSFLLISHQDLSDHPALWGKPVSDERFAIIADLAAAGENQGISFNVNR